MKILLLGEYSGLFYNLKDGLIKNKHKVFLANNGDGWKKFDNDLSLGNGKSGIINKIGRLLIPIINIRKFKNYDIVQIINSNLITSCSILNYFFFIYIIRNNKEIFISGAGHDSIVWEYFLTKYRYPGLIDGIIEDNKKAKRYYESKIRIFLEKRIFLRIDGIIPIMYEYAEPYRRKFPDKTKNTIPIPMNVDEIKYHRNIINDKIVIFHGVNRNGFKGTKYVVEALKYIKEKYKDRVSVIIQGRLRFEEYIKLLETTNIVIDQTFSVSYGVNAVYAMALGKVVLGGGKEECLKEYGIKNIPIIPIEPNVENIIGKLEYLLNNTSLIENIGLQSRLYVEKIHSSKSIARKYEDVWNHDNKAY